MPSLFLQPKRTNVVILSKAKDPLLFLLFPSKTNKFVILSKAKDPLLPLPLSLPLHLPLLLFQPPQFCHPEQSEGPAIAFAFPIQNEQNLSS
jgi:hypothetical protein